LQRGVGDRSGSGGLGATALFSSTTPGFHADAASVPPGICFVTITADSGAMESRAGMR
jgi:hypothetical protein